MVVKIDERKKIGGIDHIQVSVYCCGLIGRFLRWCGLLRIEYDLFMLGSPEYVGKIPPHLEVECDCDHEPAPERVVFDGFGADPHMEAGWFVVHQQCSKCRRELGRWLQRDVVLGDGTSLRECLEAQVKNGLRSRPGQGRSIESMMNRRYPGLLRPRSGPGDDGAPPAGQALTDRESQ